MLDRIRVLHVDDEPDLGELVATFLERADDRLDIETAMDADEGLEMLADGDFDCVVSDYDMPGQNGIDFLETIRSRRPDLPFILYTGKGSEDVASSAITAGATDYLQKEGGTDQYTVLANRIVNVVERERAQTTMGEVRHLFSELANSTNDVLWLFSQDWEELVFVTDAYEDIYGQPRATLEANPRAFLDAVHPDDRDRVTRTMQTLSNGESADIEYRVNEAEDYSRHVWAKADPITDADGTVTHIGGFTRDITDRKDRERELERTRDLFEKTERIADVDGWEIDTETMNVFWTGNLFELLGVDDEEPPLEGALGVYHEDNRPIVEAALEDGDPFDVDVRFRTPDSEVRWLRVKGIPTVEDGTVVTLRGAVQDITDQKHYEQTLDVQNERLEEFASAVSHDIRNPLNVADGHLELAREEYDSDHLRGVARAHDRMKTIIDDMLALAREGEHVSDLEAVDLEAVVQGCWRHVETAAATLRVSTEMTIEADRSRLQQLLENLVRNAVEHGGQDVTVTVAELDDGFYVEDDGVGLPPEAHDDVFELGYSTTENGTGFGLPIVQRMAEVHDWDLTLCDGADGGTRVEITGVESRPQHT
jgi:PAS domain S-box-containing protein